MITLHMSTKTYLAIKSENVDSLRARRGTRIVFDESLDYGKVIAMNEHDEAVLGIQYGVKEVL